MLNGRLVLYARRDATDQLRKLHGISITVMSREIHDNVLIVHVHAKNKDGREDEDFGTVSMVYPDRTKDRDGRWIDHPRASEALAGEERGNAILKGITKAKRRVTLSICGLGFLDELEIETISPATKKAPEAKERMKTLPKKDARPMYTKLSLDREGPIATGTPCMTKRTAHLSCAAIIASPILMSRSPRPSRPMLCAVTRAPSSSRRKTSGPVEPASRKDPRPLAIAANNQPLAVVFDFVNPLAPVRRCGANGWQTRLYEARW
jgi:hypothetical protein